MSKIKALLEKAGVNPELSKQICGSLDSYKTTLREQFENDYRAKIEQAKQVVVEETESHKRELAKRVQIFCETKGAAIEAQLSKQSALNESEATAKLKNIVTVLHGLEPNSRPSGNVTAEIKKLKNTAQVATEEKDKAIQLANRKSAIAEKALKRNRELATAMKSIQESSTSTVSESRKASSTKGRKLATRKSGKARSTRATLAESQDRRPAPRKQISQNQSPFSIDSIAAQVDEDVI
tara:strand:+ start:2224 stop:2937 length:714 start_codon:yes stop_codon:yes gene_type:complete